MIKLAPHLPRDREDGLEGLTVEKRVCSSIWVIKTSETYRSIGDRFGLNKGSLWRVTVQVVHSLIAVIQDIIHFPNQGDFEELANKWESLAGFPGVVGK